MEGERRSIQFAGRRWWVKRATEPFGPGPNRFDDSEATVEVDAAGHLVLRVRRHAGSWVCAEVVGEDTTGYGRYGWTVVTQLGAIDRNVVAGMFTWSDDQAQHHREIDIEVSAWGAGGVVDGRFVVAPFDRPGHVQPFAVPSVAPWRCSFDWLPGRVVFRVTGVPAWTFAGGLEVPTPGGVHPRLNLWLYRGVPPQTARPVEVAFTDFTFTPPAG